MSGGHYNYAYNKINDLISDIEKDLQGSEMYENCNTSEDHIWLQKEVYKLLTLLIDCSRRARELEWYMSGDNGIESYRENIKKINEA